MLRHKTEWEKTDVVQTVGRNRLPCDTAHASKAGERRVECPDLV